MDGSNVLKALEASADGTMAKEELRTVLEYLSPGEWTNGKFDQLAESLGTDALGRVYVAKLFNPQLASADVKLKAAIFSAAHYVREFMKPFVEKFPGSFFVEQDCCMETAHLCQGANAACVFVNDEVPRQVLQIFKANGIKLVLLRCAGFDRVDLEAAQELGIKVLRVPAYSPYAVAEHAVSLAVTLNRRLHLARNRVRQGNYELSGLVGMDLNGKTVGILGTGKIGQIAAKIFKGFGMHIAAYDVFQNDVIKDLGGTYMPMDDVLACADVISLHVPLLPQTTKMINRETIAKMKPGVILINVSRGALVDTQALIEGLTAGIIRAVGIDVYEKEGDLFFKDFSNMDEQSRMAHWDQTFALLRSFNNVLITPHSAFLTSDALGNIVGTTIQNAEEFVAGGKLTNEVKPMPAPAAAAPAAPAQAAAPAGGPLRRRSMAKEGAPPPGMTINQDMKVAIFSTSEYVRKQMDLLVKFFPNSYFVDARCDKTTAHLAAGAQAVCLFVNDDGDKEVMEIFKRDGVKLVLLRCAGFDRMDMAAAGAAGIKVARVPAYSPYAVAEHAASLCMCINRRLHRCYNRVQDGIFLLSGLVGKDLNGKVCGIMGTGKIGQIAAKIFKGLGMEVICYDVFKNDVITKELGLQYVELDELYARSEVISVHVPLLDSTKYIINEESIAKMKPGVILLNVSRGGLVKTSALVDGIASGKIGGAGLDVYENEKDIFFQNFSAMDDDSKVQAYDHLFMHLRSLPNVVVTPHTAFLTEEALENICSTTITNLCEFVDGKELANEVKPPK